MAQNVQSSCIRTIGVKNSQITRLEHQYKQLQEKFPKRWTPEKKADIGKTFVNLKENITHIRRDLNGIKSFTKETTAISFTEFSSGLIEYVKSWVETKEASMLQMVHGVYKTALDKEAEIKSMSSDISRLDEVTREKEKLDEELKKLTSETEGLKKEIENLKEEKRVRNKNTRRISRWFKRGTNCFK